jgi:hypothetical protein
LFLGLGYRSEEKGSIVQARVRLTEKEDEERKEGHIKIWHGLIWSPLVSFS